MPGAFVFSILNTESRWSDRAIVRPICCALRLAHIREADIGRRGRTRQDGSSKESRMFTGKPRMLADMGRQPQTVSSRLTQTYLARCPPRATAAGSLAIAHRPP